MQKRPSDSEYKVSENHIYSLRRGAFFGVFGKNLFLLTTNVLFGIFTGVINYYYICSCKKDATWWACTLCTSVNEWPRDVERSSPWPKCYPHFFFLWFTREEGGQGSVSSVLHTNRSGQSRMEVAWDASAWLVAITITLVRVIAFVSSQHRSETKFGSVGGGVSGHVNCYAHWSWKCCLCYQ